MAGKGNVVSRVQALCAPIAADLGLSLWDVRFVKEGTQHYLRVFIDKDGGVSMDDCVAMSTDRWQKFTEVQVTPALLDALSGKCSEFLIHAVDVEGRASGIERELVQDSHFLQYIGAPVLVRTIRPVDGARDFSGTLEQYNNGEITVRLTSGKALCVQKKDTAFVKLDDFNIADFEQDFQG